MAFLIVPEKEELAFRKTLHGSPKTMSFSHTEAFPESDWDEFYEKHVKADPKKEIYRLLFCDGCMDFTAESSWHYDEELHGYLLNILVKGDLRREGYGNETLRLMKGEAISHGIHTFYAKASENNTDAIAFMKHEGFKEVQRKDGNVICQLDF